MNCFDLSLQLNGYPIKRAERDLKSRLNASSVAFQVQTEKLKTEILEHHFHSTLFYRELVGDSLPSNWTDLPIMGKSDLQVPLKDRLSSDLNHKLYKNKTSGSTGNPMTFAKDKYCHALTWSYIKNCYNQWGIDLNRSYQARFYGIPKTGLERSLERVKDRIAGRKRFSVFDLSDNAFEKVTASFRKNTFDHITGYATVLVEFAGFLAGRGIVLKHLCPSLQVCFSTSEMLFDHDRELMRTAFGVPIVNEYGAAELDLIGFENTSGQLLTNTATLYIEIVDDNGRILPPELPGRVIVTALYNRAHPFIRYDLGDRAALAFDAQTGHPYFKNLVGRSDDLIHLPSGKTAAGLTLYYITKALMNESYNVKTFIIEQHTLSSFKVCYQSPELLNDLQKENVKKAFETYLESGLDVTFEHVDHLAREDSGKFKQFRSKLKSQA